MPRIELAPEDALDVDAVDHLLDRGQHLIDEFDFADAERPTAAGQAEPAEEEARQLPQRVEPEASRHDRIALEMATEEPQLRLDVELGAHFALAMGAAGLGDVDDAIEHQHRRQRQLRVSGAEQVAAAAGQEIFVGEMGAPFGHARVDSLGFADAVAPRAGLLLGFVTQAGASRKRRAPILLSKWASAAANGFRDSLRLG